MHSFCIDAVRSDLEQADDALLLTERRAAHIKNVVQSLELDGPVHAQIGDGAFRKTADERDVDGSCAVDHRRIDACNASVYDAVAGGDFSLLAQLDVLRLLSVNLDFR